MSEGPKPEADAFEQAQPVAPDTEREEPHTGHEVPEADALEQAEEVPMDEEEDEGR